MPPKSPLASPTSTSPPTKSLTSLIPKSAISAPTPPKSPTSTIPKSAISAPTPPKSDLSDSEVGDLCFSSAEVADLSDSEVADLSDSEVADLSSAEVADLCSSSAEVSDLCCCEVSNSSLYHYCQIRHAHSATSLSEIYRSTSRVCFGSRIGNGDGNTRGNLSSLCNGRRRRRQFSAGGQQCWEKNV